MPGWRASITLIEHDPRRPREDTDRVSGSGSPQGERKWAVGARSKSALDAAPSNAGRARAFAFSLGIMGGGASRIEARRVTPRARAKKERSPEGKNEFGGRGAPGAGVRACACDPRATRESSRWMLDRCSAGPANFPLFLRSARARALFIVNYCERPFISAALFRSRTCVQDCRFFRPGESLIFMKGRVPIVGLLARIFCKIHAARPPAFFEEGNVDFGTRRARLRADRRHTEAYSQLLREVAG